jgi:2-ketocyclohexanecarboxyl-CoA hydrolase
MEYKDILYETRGAAVWITINRPDKYNAFRGVTCEELIHAITRAGWDKSVAAIVLTGAGEKAFCTGGDQSAHDGGYDGRGTIGLPVEELQSSIRDVPKPVIARQRFCHRWRQRSRHLLRPCYCRSAGGVRSGRTEGWIR